MLKRDTFHMSEHYRIILHSLPELATTVLWGVGGVVEGEWFGGAASTSFT